MDGSPRPVSLDVVRGARNISSVEQEFQSTPTVDRAAQLLALVLDAEREPARPRRARRRPPSCPRAPRRACSPRSSSTGLVEQEGERGGFRAGPVHRSATPAARRARRLRELAEQPMAVLAERPARRSTSRCRGDGGVEHVAQTDGRHFLGTTPVDRPPRALPLHGQRQGAARLRRRRAARRPARGAHLAHDRRPPRARRRARDGARRGLRDRASTSSSSGSARSPRPSSTRTARAVAALSVSGPTLRLSPRRVAELRPIVIKQARALSEALGHRPEGVHAA